MMDEQKIRKIWFDNVDEHAGVGWMTLSLIIARTIEQAAIAECVRKLRSADSLDEGLCAIEAEFGL